MAWIALKCSDCTTIRYRILALGQCKLNGCPICPVPLFFTARLAFAFTLALSKMLVECFLLIALSSYYKNCKSEEKNTHTHKLLFFHRFLWWRWWWINWFESECTDLWEWRTSSSILQSMDIFAGYSKFFSFNEHCCILNGDEAQNAMNQWIHIESICKLDIESVAFQILHGSHLL